jgi:hypothetical protein
MHFKIVKTFIRNSTLAKSAITRAERWLRDELYAEIPEPDFQEFVELLSIDKLESVSLTREGSTYDGGYVFCDVGVKYEKLISFGVGDNCDFEVALSRLVREIDLYDHTVGELPLQIKNGTFHKVGLSHISMRGFATLEEVSKDLLAGQHNLLKIDIEGGEWNSIDLTDTQELRKYSQIFLELHNLHQIDNLQRFEQYTKVLRKLRKNHYLVSIHGNNWSPYSVIKGVPIPDVVEITLLRKDMYEGEILMKPDQDLISNSRNNPNRPEYRLIF